MTAFEPLFLACWYVGSGLVVGTIFVGGILEWRDGGEGALVFLFAVLISGAFAYLLQLARNRMGDSFAKAATEPSPPSPKRAGPMVLLLCAALAAFTLASGVYEWIANGESPFILVPAAGVAGLFLGAGFWGAGVVKARERAGATA